ncbi:hypothetical protein QBC39DRAFT_148161 [Podospora conica]|nr:hypothetical protein QBC39DRAFT_148161 [Schizothecium conicum]
MNPTTTTTTPSTSGQPLFDPHFGNVCPPDKSAEQHSSGFHDNTQTAESMLGLDFRATTGAGYNLDPNVHQSYGPQTPLDSMTLASATSDLWEQEQLWAGLGYGPLPETNEIPDGDCSGFEAVTTWAPLAQAPEPRAVAGLLPDAPSQVDWQHPDVRQEASDDSGHGTTAAWEHPRIQYRVEIPTPSFPSHTTSLTGPEEQQLTSRDITRARNRAAAQRYREKKKVNAETLHAAEYEMEAEREVLTHSIQELRAEVQNLRNEVHRQSGCECGYFGMEGYQSPEAERSVHAPAAEAEEQQRGVGLGVWSGECQKTSGDFQYDSTA